MTRFGIGKDYVVTFDSDINGWDSDDVYVKDMVAGFNLVVFRKVGSDIRSTLREGDLRCEDFTITRLHAAHVTTPP
jgi:hypothetical protein